MERILYQKSIPTTQLQLYRTVNDGKECQERDFLWPYDKVDIEKKMRLFFEGKNLLSCRWNDRKGQRKCKGQNIHPFLDRFEKICGKEEGRKKMGILRVSRQQIKLIPLRSYHWQTSVERGWEQPDEGLAARCHWVTGKFCRPRHRQRPWLPADIPFTIEPLTAVN